MAAFFDTLSDRNRIIEGVPTSISSHINPNVSVQVQFTCSKTDQFLSQADELQVKFRILEANFLKFGVLVP